MTVLNLILEKKWFDLIASGRKTIEYREYKPHWISRLMRNGALRDDFTEVHFRNGYKSDAPFMKVQVENLTLYARRFIAPMNGEEITADKYFSIALGKV